MSENEGSNIAGLVISARYEVQKVLGQGGAGEVYLAWDTQLRRTVAIKKIRQGGLYRDEADSSEIARGAWMEAMCLAAVRHPNIVAVYDLGMEGNLPYLVMEYVQGETLDRRVVRSILDSDEFIELARQVLGGMVAAHQTGLVHRDLKPENIILARMPAGHFQAKILDFGIAKYLHQPEVQTMDLDETIKGSVHWISPEQLNGEPIDERCDIYSLGCVFYFALTGTPPFGSGNPTSIITAHLMHHVTPIHAIRPDLAEPLCEWVMSLIERSPSDRPQTALAALEKIQEITGPRRSSGTSVQIASGSPSLSNAPSFESSPTMRIEMAAPTAAKVGWNHWAFAPENQKKIRRNFLWLAAFAIPLLLIGAFWFKPTSSNSVAQPSKSSTAPPVSPVCALRIHGSNTIGTKMAPMLLEAFLKKHGATQIKVVSSQSPLERRIDYLSANDLSPAYVELHSHGSKTAFAGLANGLCDLGMSSSTISDEEVERLERLGLGNMRMPSCEQVVALDGLAILVNPSNTILQLDRKQLAAIFSGRVRDWSELGRERPGAIHLYARDNASGTFDTFKSLVMNGDLLATEAKRFEDSSDLSDQVAADPDAIGFTGLPFIRNSKAIAIGDADTQALVPTRFTIATEDYVLSRRLYFYCPANSPSPMIRAFIDFALSEEGQNVVSESGFIKQSVEIQKIFIPPNAPAMYRDLANDAGRLSLSLRFRSGTNTLDSKAERDLDRILKALEHPKYRGYALSLVGFSDKGASFEEDLLRSNSFLETVTQALQIRGVQPRYLRGFGSDLAVSSNETDAGRSKNRRVEVWLQSGASF